MHPYRSLLVLVLLSLCSVGRSRPEVTSYHGQSFSHLKIHAYKGNEYLVVAQKNEIVYLRSDFKWSSLARIGPRNDSVKLGPRMTLRRGTKPNPDVSPHDIYVQAMEIFDGHLYVCFSYLQGSCDKIELTDSAFSVNFSVIEDKLKSEPLAGLCPSPQAKTLLTVARSPKSNESLYVAMEQCSIGSFEYSITVESIISVISLQTLRPFVTKGFSEYRAEIIPEKDLLYSRGLTYHYSFSYKNGSLNYVYFLLSVRVASKVGLQSRRLSRIMIGRLCSNDEFLSSYVEAQVNCSLTDEDNAEFDHFGDAATLVKAGSQLSASFGVPQEEYLLLLSVRTGSNSSRHGVCATPMSEINDKLDGIVSDCQTGQALWGPEYVRETRSCNTNLNSHAFAPFCSLNNQMPNEWFGMFSRSRYRRILAKPLLRLRDGVKSLAALALQSGATVVFVGTDNGRLLRYHVGARQHSWLFANSSACNSTKSGPVLSIAVGADRLFTLTPNEVMSHRYADCQSFHSCSACLGSKNPHCVWSNEATGGCRVWDEPSKPDKTRYVTIETSCMQVTAVENQEVNVDTSDSSVFVSIHTRNSPSVPFYCFYLDERGKSVTESRPAESELYHTNMVKKVKCPTSIDKLRTFLGGNTKRQLTLIVSGDQFKAQSFFASVKVLVFTCRTHGRCSECLSSHSKCKWCSLRSICVQNVATNCPNDVSDGSVIGNSTQCPFVKLVYPPKLLVPSGTNPQIQYSLNGYQVFMHTFTCSLKCSDSHKRQFVAALSPNRRQLNCHIGVLDYEQHTATRRCSLTFHWVSGGTQQQLDSDTNGLVMYKCEQMAKSCDTCTLYTQPQYNCKWCNGHCSDKCLAGGVQRGQLCLPPAVRSVKPSKLTQYGNLLLNVSGSNLGVTASDVAAQLEVSDGTRLPCGLVSGTYRPGRSFVCLVPGGVSEQIISLNVTARVRVLLRQAPNASCTSAFSLSVHEPSLTSLSASEVQLTGRAVVRAFGRHLDAGSSLQLSLQSDSFMPASATVLSRRSDTVELRVSNFVKPGRYFVELGVQERAASWSLRNVTLTVVSDVTPTVVPPAALLPAGGLPFRVTGQHLRAVQRAQLLLSELSGFGQLKSDCHHVKGAIVCPSPAVPLSRLRRAAKGGSFDHRANFSVKLMLDEIGHSCGRVTLLPQPQLLPLESSTVTLAGDASDDTQELRIRARDLLPAVRPADIRVSVGNLRCGVLSLQPLSDGLEMIVCNHQLESWRQGVPLEVTAVIGNKAYKLGSITYNSRIEVAAYLYAAGGMAVALIFACCIAGITHVLRRNSRQEKSRRVEVQINLLEAQVSQNCRDAFAELQLNSSGDKKLEESLMPAPIRSFEEFACCSCFPERYRDRHSCQDSIFTDVCARSFVPETGETRKALHDFHNLLRNEDFLIAMVTAMEWRSDEFKHHERNQFGSLLSALLYYDIGYFTRVLTKLVQALVAKKSEANDNYKVMFRRCDSVADRLLPNWLAFLMYEQLSTRVAEPLYQLYCGIKQQVYKGPVDQITEDSKYTINEQKLLKKEIQFKELTLNFEDRLRLFNDEVLTCQIVVLDCDSVYQAKEKVLDAVYTRLNVPHSRREKAHSFVLTQTHCDAEQLEVNGNERYLELKEVEDPDSSGVRRLCRLSSFSLNDTDNAVFFLKRRREFAEGSGQRSMSRGVPSYPEISSLPSANSCRSLQDTRQISSSSSRLRPPESRYCHLLPPHSGTHTIDRTNRKKRRRGISERSDSQQIVSEVFYPVLLRTKRLLTDRITDLFTSLFPPERPEHTQPVPLCVKYLFDILDDLVHEKQLSREVAHVWKANTLMLRFYTHNLLNLDCLLDLAAPGPVKFCMSTVSTLFMDACSVEKPSTPDKSSPAQKLLFVNEIADFHPQVEGYFKRISAGIREPVPVVLQRLHEQVKLRQSRPFNIDALLLELFHNFARKYYDDIVQQLKHSSNSESMLDCLAFVSRTLVTVSPYCSNSHTLCSTQSSTKPLNAVGNVYDTA